MAQEKQVDRNTAIRKLKACLRLSKSSNPNEASAAMRQAQKLMQLYDLTTADADDVAVCSHETRYRGKKGLPRRLQSLGNTVATVFRCIALGVTRHGERARVVFVGPGSMPELALYAYVQLERQLTRAVTDFRKNFPRLPKKWPRLREDFADGWILEACRQIPAPPLDDGVADALIAHYEAHKGSLVKRNDEKKKKAAGGRKRTRTPAFGLGAQIGRETVVHQGMGGETIAGIEYEN